MTRWEALREAVQTERSGRKRDWTTGLVAQVRRAASWKVCADFEPYRVKKDGRVIRLAPRDGITMKAKKAEVPAIALFGLPALGNTKMAFRVFLARDQKRVEQYVISVTGTERASGRSWYARIDLDNEQKGEGPCSHAMLHVHVGVDPHAKGLQETRVPLPWLDPDEALAWVFATLDPRLEPGPA